MKLNEIELEMNNKMAIVHNEKNIHIEKSKKASNKKFEEISNEMNSLIQELEIYQSKTKEMENKNLSYKDEIQNKDSKIKEIEFKTKSMVFKIS